MGLALAIKRSYRFFTPPSLLSPRKLVRRLFEPMFFYVMGITTGMYAYARPGEGKRITEISIIAMLVLFALKWWSGASKMEVSPRGAGH